MSTTSVIVTTYNRIEALVCVIEGLKMQRVLPNEVIIADDGSDQATKDKVKQLQATVPFPLIHVWQEDDGFRAAQIRNKAAARASYDYLIFMDGDCIPRKDFIQNHLQFQQCNKYITGNRILLSAAMTAHIEQTNDLPIQWSVWRIFNEKLKGHINRLLPLLKLPDGQWRSKTQSHKWQGARTCNLALFKTDFDKVNGFDERYQGWGHEDADLAIRLINHAILRKDGRWGTGVYHLWHQENDRSNEQENRQRLQVSLDTVRNKAEIT